MTPTAIGHRSSITDSSTICNCTGITPPPVGVQANHSVWHEPMEDP
jgi:hypothetical protein